MPQDQFTQHTHHHDHDHAHGHDHDHHHHHGIPTELPGNAKAFVWGIVLNGVFVVAEVIGGFATHSLSLLTDAGHNFSDVATLGLSLLSLRMAKVKPTDTYTYGYRKTTVLTALFNTLILFIAIGMIAWESIQRMLTPQQPVEGKDVAIIALIGIAVNAVSAFFFFRSKDHELNSKAAYIHLLADALVSLGVVITGVIIYFTGWAALDTIVSWIMIIVLIAGSWNLLKESIRLSLDGVPFTIKLADVEQKVAAIPNVKGIHHVHIWAVSTTANALTAHIVVDDHTTPEQQQQLKEKIKHELEHLNITHTTLEFEMEEFCCEEETVVSANM